MLHIDLLDWRLFVILLFVGAKYFVTFFPSLVISKSNYKMFHAIIMSIMFALGFILASLNLIWYIGTRKQFEFGLHID